MPGLEPERPVQAGVPERMPGDAPDTEPARLLLNEARPKIEAEGFSEAT